MSTEQSPETMSDAEYIEAIADEAEKLPTIPEIGAHVVRLRLIAAKLHAADLRKRVKSVQRTPE